MAKMTKAVKKRIDKIMTDGIKVSSELKQPFGIIEFTEKDLPF